jgi:hypothetical protein
MFIQLTNPRIRQRERSQVTTYFLANNEKHSMYKERTNEQNTTKKCHAKKRHVKLPHSQNTPKLQ